MKTGYEKPEVVCVNSKCEGVYLASGGNDVLAECRFGRTEASAGSDQCQECSVSGGTRNKPLPGEESAREDDFKTCVDNMPLK